MNIRREKELRQAGIEVGKQVPGDTPYPQAHQPGIAAANKMGLKKQAERLAFAGGYGWGRGERMCQDIDQKYQGGAT